MHEPLFTETTQIPFVVRELEDDASRRRAHPDARAGPPRAVSSTDRRAR
jgi:hypothetical protein